jgi:hypothetical protein
MQKLRITMLRSMPMRESFVCRNISFILVFIVFGTFQKATFFSRKGNSFWNVFMLNVVFQEMYWTRHASRIVGHSGSWRDAIKKSING